MMFETDSVTPEILSILRTLFIYDDTDHNGQVGSTNSQLICLSYQHYNIYE